MTILESTAKAVKSNKVPSASASGANRAAGTAEAKGLLVTNTESASPLSLSLSLKAPSLLALEKMQPISRRYVLQSISKEMLGACSVGSGDGNRPEFYRLGACQQLSASYRPDSTYDESYSKGLHFSLNSDQKLFEVFANNFSSGLSKKEVNGITSVQMTGLCSCDSNWICPVCQPKVSDYRAKELAYAIHQHQSNDGYCLFVTFTVPHSKSDSLDFVINGLTNSVRKFKSGKSFQVFKNRHGFVGSVRALEWTYTETNGHHPHIHELWFLDEMPDIKTIKKWVYDKYAALVLKHLGTAPSFKHGVDVKLVLTNSQVKNLFDDIDINDLQALSSYISKGSDVDKSSIDFIKNRNWSIADEMTKSNYKKSKKTKDGKSINSFNAVTILLEYLQLQYITDKTQSKVFLKEMVRLKNIYTEYARATFGRAALFWSRGLKDRFGVYELDDKLLVDEHDAYFTQFMSFDLDELQFIIKNRLRAKLCDIASNPIYKNDNDRRLAVKNHIQLVKDRGRSDRFG